MQFQERHPGVQAARTAGANSCGLPVAESCVERVFFQVQPENCRRTNKQPVESVLEEGTRKGKWR